jgi:hypothetical protein
MGRFAFFFFFLPIAVVIIILSIANREVVTLSLDPIGAPAPGWSITAPFFVFMFAVLALGVLVGGIATWIGQSKWRHAARTERAASNRLRQDLERERQRIASESVVLPAPPEHI